MSFTVVVVFTDFSLGKYTFTVLWKLFCLRETCWDSPIALVSPMNVLGGSSCLTASRHNQRIPSFILETTGTKRTRLRNLLTPYHERITAALQLMSSPPSRRPIPLCVCFTLTPKRSFISHNCKGRHFNPPRARFLHSFHTSKVPAALSPLRMG